jgi:hypothetical protein
MLASPWAAVRLDIYHEAGGTQNQRCSHFASVRVQLEQQPGEGQSRLEILNGIYTTLTAVVKH